MGDSAAVRAKRARHHKAGDHSLCVRGRCEALGGPVRIQTGLPGRPRLAPPGVFPPPAPRSLDPRRAGEVRVERDPESGERVPGKIELSVKSFVEALPYEPPDPRALLADIAVRLAQRVDETGALPAAVRELRVLLVQLTEVPNGPAGPVDEMRLRSAARRLDSILATAS